MRQKRKVKHIGDDVNKDAEAWPSWLWGRTNRCLKADVVGGWSLWQVWWVINLGRQVISFFTECRGDWFHLSGAVGDWVRYCMYVWECYLETSQREYLTRQFLTLSFHSLFRGSGWHLFGIWPGHLGLAIIIEHRSELRLLAVGDGDESGMKRGEDWRGRAEGEIFHCLCSPLVYLFYFFRSWFLFSSKYTAILASSPGGRGRKNLLPSGPLWK